MSPLAPPLRVAVVGAGPAGFFATADLLKLADLAPQVDMFERLPTPYGLVRNGVAPDHQSIKAIAGRYERDAAAAGGRFRLFGNVEIGRDLTLDELSARYHAVVLAFGAQSNRRMGIPGEELGGVHAASVFVAWYNGHPDTADLEFDLSAERAVVVGAGNVALDVARILMRPREELARTDISDRALAALSRKQIREVFVLGRGSQAQATYTPAELEELARMPGVDLVVAPADRRLDEATLAQRAAGRLDARVERNLRIVDERARPQATPGRPAIHLRFFASPLAALGDERVTALRVGENRVVNEGGVERLEPTGRQETLACGLVFRAIGYRVAPLAGVPFDEATASVPHAAGQVLLSPGGAPAPGLFVTGWAKRGPSGVIGTNKPDATETVKTLVAAWHRAELRQPPLADPASDVAALLAARGRAFVSFSDWKLLDQLEVESGKADGRPRRKFLDYAEMLRALALAKMGAVPHDRLIGRGAS